MSAASRNRFKRLKLWDKRSKYNTARQRNTAKILSMLYGVKEKLALSDAIKERTAYLYVSASKKRLVAGRHAIDVLGAAIYCACREFGVHRSLKAIAKALDIKEKSLKKCYRMLITKINIRPDPPKPELSLSKICSELKIDEKTKRHSLQIIDEARKKQESFLPFYVKGFSDFYLVYNNYVDQTFRMMKLGKQAIGIKPNESLEKPYDECIDSFFFELYQNMLGTSKEFIRGYSQLRVSFLKSHNIYLKKTIDIYEQIYN